MPCQACRFVSSSGSKCSVSNSNLTTCTSNYSLHGDCCSPCTTATFRIYYTQNLATADDLQQLQASMTVAPLPAPGRLSQNSIPNAPGHGCPEASVPIMVFNDLHLATQHDMMFVHHSDFHRIFHQIARQVGLFLISFSFIFSSIIAAIYLLYIDLKSSMTTVALLALG